MEAGSWKEQECKRASTWTKQNRHTHRHRAHDKATICLLHLSLLLLLLGVLTKAEAVARMPVRAARNFMVA